MYAYVKAGQVVQIVNARAWNDPATGVQHPASIFSLWSKTDLANIGLYPVVQSSSPDNEFNTMGSASYSFDADNNQVVETISSKEKNLNDVNEVDDNGDAVLDSEGNQLVTKGLKTIWIEKTKATAKSLLSPTDWYVVRNVEDNTQSIPSEVTTHRTSVRTASNTIETAITDASDMTAFKALFVVPTDSIGKPTGKAPIHNFPDSYGE